MSCLDQLTIAELKEVAKLVTGLPQSTTTKFESGFKVGKAYFIRTATYHFLGRVVRITDDEVELETASWIPVGKRHYNFLKDGALDEVEPFPDNVHIRLTIIGDYTEWKHELPTTQM